MIIQTWVKVPGLNQVYCTEKFLWNHPLALDEGEEELYVVHVLERAVRLLMNFGNGAGHQLIGQSERIWCINIIRSMLTCKARCHLSASKFDPKINFNSKAKNRNEIVPRAISADVFACNLLDPLQKKFTLVVIVFAGLLHMKIGG